MDTEPLAPAVAALRAFAVPAGAAASGAWEAAVNAAWTVAPDKAAERDRRWLALLVAEKTFWLNIKTDFEATGRRPEAVAKVGGGYATIRRAAV